MGLDLTSLPLSDISKLAIHGIECISHRNKRIRIELVLVRLVIREKLLTRNGHINKHMEMIALLVMTMMHLNHNVTAHNVTPHMTELVNTVPNFVFQRVRVIGISKDDVDDWIISRSVHESFPYRYNPTRMAGNLCGTSSRNSRKEMIDQL